MNTFHNRQLRRDRWVLAYIHEESGQYYITSEDGSCFDPTPYPTKLAAMTAAASGPDAYTHAIGSGTYWPGVRSIRAFRQE
jgi:hypothetical protein